MERRCNVVREAFGRVEFFRERLDIALSAQEVVWNEVVHHHQMRLLERGQQAVMHVMTGRTAHRLETLVRRSYRGCQPSRGVFQWAHFFFSAACSAIRLSLIDRGFVYAIAHIRGGQELGREWYENGRQLQKMNTFYDFIDCADYLVKNKYSSTDRLVIQGGSAGGLLMGAVVNMRPDLFKAVVAQVPFVDVINTMMDATLPLTTSEYIEWGNPNHRDEFEYMIKYSPYDNVTAQKYPAMLVQVSLNDSQVP